MNASAQALSISLTRKIANVAVMFRAEFPAAMPDLSPWLTDDFTQQHLKPTSIDLSFASLQTSDLLNCRCILLQILFSDALLEPTCRLVGIEASGHDHQGQCWSFSTEADWQFEGNRIPKNCAQQQRFVYLLQQILSLFNDPAALSQSILD
ncbi:MAG: hypothetical protein AAGA83_03650 [Cyanobacteria bacterium P01_F01_bin.116]